MKKKNKYIVLIASIILIIAAVLSFIFISNRKPKTLTVGFFGIDDYIESLLTEEISQYNPKAKFITFDSSKSLRDKDIKKCTMLFAYKGAVTDEFEDKALVIPEALNDKVSINLLNYHSSNGNFTTLPLVMDHFEIAYYTTFQNEAMLFTPKNLESLESYFERITTLAPYATIVAGADDNELMSFVSAMALSLYGKQRYMNVLEEIELCVKNKKSLPASLTSVLDYIKEMEGKSLYSSYLDAQVQDIEFFMKNHQLGSAFMSLSTHRLIPSLYIKYYESNYVPASVNAETSSTICPTICAMYFDNQHGEEFLLAHLIGDEVQEMLSNETKLSPASSRAPCYDLQSDDVRFWAAALGGGPLPSIQDKCCLNDTQVALLCNKVRDYLSK